MAFEEVDNWVERNARQSLTLLYKHTEDTNHYIRAERKRKLGQVRWVVERSRDGRETWDEVEMFEGWNKMVEAHDAAYEYAVKHN